MEYTSTATAGKDISGDQEESPPDDAFPSGLLFQRNRKFNGEKAKYAKKHSQNSIKALVSA